MTDVGTSTADPGGVTDITVRQATASDAARILEVKRAAISELARDTYGRAQLSAWAPDESDREAFERVLDRAAVFVLVATVEEEVAGYGVLNTDAGRLDALFVHPDHAREGVASTLMGQLELGAAMADIEKLTLVSSVNAVEFYERRGYWRLEPTTRVIDGTELTFVRMSKLL